MATKIHTPIDASAATLKTVSVEVRVIRIDKKQMTQSVFKQLQSSSIIDPETGELRGIPWGRVNYHADCDGLYQPHLHVVWQKENELRRSIAYLPWQKSSHATRRMRDCLNVVCDSLSESSGGHFFNYTELVNDMVLSRLNWGIGAACDEETTLAQKSDTVALTIERVGGYIDAYYNELCQWQQSYSQLKQLDQLFIAV